MLLAPSEHLVPDPVGHGHCLALCSLSIQASPPPVSCIPLWEFFRGFVSFQKDSVAESKHQL